MIFQRRSHGLSGERRICAAEYDPLRASQTSIRIMDFFEISA
jgi:hypothetical protein